MSLICGCDAVAGLSHTTWQGQCHCAALCVLLSSADSLQTLAMCNCAFAGTTGQNTQVATPEIQPEL